jgi:hypothetical protein
MERAVVAIGVKRTGGLPELQAALESARSFAAWARDVQGIPADRVTLITDDSEKVTRDRIFEAIEGITGLGFVEQLLVYFSGHGINANRGEKWLLSRAPEDPQAAVNVVGSEMLARSAGIRHVVLISDACRTAADSIQAQAVTGGEIFPNLPPSGPENPVDQFFATLVGHPAYEVKDVQTSAQRYRAAYTSVMLSALGGGEPSIVESDAEGRLIRPRPLKKHLRTAVPLYLRSLNVSLDVNQEPDARIESDDDAWIARLGPAGAVPGGPPPPVAAPGATPTPAGETRAARGPRRPAAAPSPRATRGAHKTPAVSAAQAHDEVSVALGATRPAPTRASRGPGGRGAAPAPSALETAIGEKAATFGPDHFETKCGIKVRGIRISDAYARYAAVEVGSGGDVIKVSLPGDRRAANILVTLADGTAVVVPALADFLAGLTFDAQGELDDVSYEPSANSGRWNEYQALRGEMRRLRSVIATASALGVFRLEEDAHARELLHRMRVSKGFDPSLAVYAAYAFHDRRMRGQIRDMEPYLRGDLGVRLFDVAMLALDLGGKDLWRGNRELFPFVPLLAQGWALLEPLGVRLPGGIVALGQHLRPSLWTHFGPGGIGALRATLSSGEVG